MPRNIKADYQDPADVIWLQAAAALGITVVRSADAYASWDGRGTLTLASEQFLDADDCLAQMIFHEVCHLLVSGEGARELPDWGLDNTSPKDLVYEFATNRLQAALAQAYGLRTFMAVTTMWRPYYDALPRDPLATGDDSAIPLARSGMQRARGLPYRDILHTALVATSALADALRPVVPVESLWQFTQGRHPTGFRLHPDTELRCDDCAWAVVRRNGTIECRQTRPGSMPVNYSLDEDIGFQRTARFNSAQQACEHHEPVLTQEDCFRCGACCHRGFDVVEVSPNELFARRHPDLIEVRDTGRNVVPRPDGRCVALVGTGFSDAPFLCRHYDDRPRSCRNFELGGDACLLARQRAQR
ncbi:MAG: YkgJ family cysteine cluster protein [Pseudomonadota bacterium]